MKKQTLNKDGTPRKTGSGRTKGAASTILVKLSDVNKICKEDAYIPVATKWARTNNIDQVKMTAKVVELKPEAEESTNVEYSLTNFDD